MYTLFLYIVITCVQDSVPLLKVTDRDTGRPLSRLSLNGSHNLSLCVFLTNPFCIGRFAAGLGTLVAVIIRSFLYAFL